MVEQYDQDHIRLDNFVDDVRVADGLIDGMVRSCELYFRDQQGE